MALSCLRLHKLNTGFKKRHKWGRIKRKAKWLKLCQKIEQDTKSDWSKFWIEVLGEIFYFATQRRDNDRLRRFLQYHNITQHSFHFPTFFHFLFLLTLKSSFDRRYFSSLTALIHLIHHQLLCSWFIFCSVILWLCKTSVCLRPLLFGSMSTFFVTLLVIITVYWSIDNGFLLFNCDRKKHSHRDKSRDRVMVDRLPPCQSNILLPCSFTNSNDLFD